MFYAASHAVSRFASPPQIKDEAGIADGEAAESGRWHCLFAQESFDVVKQGTVGWHAKLLCLPVPWAGAESPCSCFVLTCFLLV
jgi:hypothetical protein